MMNCEELTRIMASDELATASWGRRMGARLHLLMCRHCRRYVEQIQALGDSARSAWKAEEEDDSTLDRLKQSILSDFEKPPRE